MKLVVLCLLLFAPVAAAEPAPLQVTAKLVEKPAKIIACGRIAYKAVVRYEVISVERGSVTGKELLVVELCPEFRKLGETRKLLLRPVNGNDSFADDFKNRPGPRYIRADLGS